MYVLDFWNHNNNFASLSNGKGDREGTLVSLVSINEFPLLRFILVLLMKDGSGRRRGVRQEFERGQVTKKF
jgi:hypothetical protein